MRLRSYATRFAQHCGVIPRVPERLVVVAFALLLLLLLAIVMVVLAWAGEFGRHSPREFFYLWILGLLLLAIAFAPRPGLALVPLSIAALDLGLGASSWALQASGRPIISALPPKFYPLPHFRWHALLQGVPVASLNGGVASLVMHHTSAGTRGREPSRDELVHKRVVAVFGGSTTYDLAVTDGETWPDRLEQQLGGQFVVLNHGVPGYSTAEHVIQTAFYADAFSRKPDCAAYYVGWNDLHNAGMPSLDAAYADFQLPSQVDALRTRRIGPDFYTPSPTATVLIRLLAIASDTVRPPARSSASPLDGPDPRLERYFVQHVEAISAVNRIRGIPTIWIGQLLNRPRLTGDDPTGWTPFVRARDVWPFQVRLNALLRAMAERVGDVYVDVPIDTFKEGDFWDLGHFLAPGSMRFAAEVAPAIAERCR
jgi:hypothetical protein